MEDAILGRRRAADRLSTINIVFCGQRHWKWQVFSLPNLLLDWRDFLIILRRRVHFAIHVTMHTNDRQSFVLKPLVQIDQHRHGVDTGAAPIAPEIDQDVFAVEVGQLERLAAPSHDAFQLRGRLTL